MSLPQLWLQNQVLERLWHIDIRKKKNPEMKPSNALGLKLGAQNLNGGNKYAKREAVVKRMKHFHHLDVFALGDTRFSEKVRKDIRKSEEFFTYFASSSSNKRGVAVYVNPRADLTVKGVFLEEEGDIVIVDTVVQGFPLLMVAVYGCNRDNPNFWLNLIAETDKFNNPNVVIMGDLNFTYDQALDTCNYNAEQNPKIRKVMNKFKEDNEIIDAYRQLYPDKQDYSWFEFNRGGRLNGRRSRLDNALVSPCLMSYITNVTYHPKYREGLDHCAITVDIDFTKFTPGKGYFRAPAHLNTNEGYIEQIKETIDNTIKDHLDPEVDPITVLATPPELLSTLKSTAKPETLFEVLLSACRDFTMGFVTERTKKLNEKKDMLKQSSRDLD